MNWETHLLVETTLQHLADIDPELHDIVEFMAELGLTFDELVSLRRPWTRTVVGGRLDVFGCEGPRSVPMTDPAWALLLTLAVPDAHHLGAIRSRWLAALAPCGLRIPFDDCVVWLAKVREADRNHQDDTVPF